MLSSPPVDQVYLTFDHLLKNTRGIEVLQYLEYIIYKMHNLLSILIFPFNMYDTLCYIHEHR